MSRSAVREVQVSGITVPRGDVVVPTQIGDPLHGMLACRAAPLVAGSLRARGRAVKLADLPGSDDPSGDFDATLYLVTCQQQDGSTAAVAAVAAPGDALSGAAARNAVEEWGAVSATRTLLLAASPWCTGALHAAGAAREAASQYEGTGVKVYLLAPVSIPAETASALSDLGAIIAPSISDVEPGSVVVFPAHGVTPEIRTEATRRQVTVIDATCPMVAAAQTAARRAAERDQQLVLISQPGHAATASIASEAPGHLSVVEGPAKTAAVRVSDSRHLSYLMQPGVAHESGASAIGALRSRYPAVKPVVPAEVCYAPSDRAGTVYSVALGSDLMLVVGDPLSADTRQVCAQARDSGTKVQAVGEIGDIKPSLLASVHTIGLAESTSAPGGLAAQVVTALSGLGRLNVVRRKLSTEKAASAPL
jgi:4-hydroxy-3-methylbut-2-en-1-yl diphosphate reductase